MKTKRFLCAAFLLLCMMAAFSQSGAEIRVPILDTHEQVVDLGKLLSAKKRSALEAKLDRIVAQLNFDVVVLTVDSLNGLTQQEYADDFYDYNNYGIDKNGNGFGQDRDGILLLVKMKGSDSGVYISTSGYGIEVFTDDVLDLIFDGLIPKLVDKKYAEAFDAFANYSDKFVTQARNSKSKYGRDIK